MEKQGGTNATSVTPVAFSLPVRPPAGDPLGKEPWRFSYIAGGLLSAISHGCSRCHRALSSNGSENSVPNGHRYLNLLRRVLFSLTKMKSQSISKNRVKDVKLERFLSSYRRTYHLRTWSSELSGIDGQLLIAENSEPTPENLCTQLICLDNRKNLF